jgi:hypothetical protein
MCTTSTEDSCSLCVCCFGGGRSYWAEITDYFIIWYPEFFENDLHHSRKDIALQTRSDNNPYKNTSTCWSLHLHTRKPTAWLICLSSSHAAPAYCLCFSVRQKVNKVDTLVLVLQYIYNGIPLLSKTWKLSTATICHASNRRVPVTTLFVTSILSYYTVCFRKNSKKT